MRRAESASNAAPPLASPSVGQDAMTRDSGVPSSPSVSAFHSTSVTNGIDGCSSRRTVSSTWPSTRRVDSERAACSAVGSSPSARRGKSTLDISRYQSQNSSHAKWYSASLALANSYLSSAASTSARTCSRRSRIQRSVSVSVSRAGSSPTYAPFISAKRVALNSFVAKLRELCAESSPTGRSEPGFAPRARVKRSASAP